MVAFNSLESEGIETCSTCRFFKMNGEECRRFPPEQFQIGELDIETRWPEVSRFDWCGEWESKGGES